MKNYYKIMVSLWFVVSLCLLLPNVAMIAATTAKAVVVGTTERFHVQHRKLLDASATDPKTTLPNALMIRLTEQYDNITDVRVVIRRLIRRAGGGTIRYVYNNAVKGASVHNLTATGMLRLLNQKAIKYATPIGMASVSAIQTNPVWGLDRIDEDDLPLNKLYNYTATGFGVTAYIIDTGIRITHRDFGGRASCGFSAFPEDNHDCNDLHFHGTHVAGTVGGTKYGVAKGVTLVGVKVLDSGGGGSWDGVAAGIDYVTGIRKRGHLRPMVINMSLGGYKNSLVNDASNNAAQAGIVVVVAAGNDHTDACDASPASAEKVITVGATDSLDSCTFFSNQGPCMEIFAPGMSVISASNECDTCTMNLDGTSMASPHVCGAAALYLQKNPTKKPHQVLNALRAAGVRNKVTDITLANTENLLLNTARLV